MRYLMNTPWIILPAVAWLSGEVGAYQAVDESLQQRVGSLEAKVSRMAASHGEDWLTEHRAAEVRALIHDVLADADLR